MTPLPRVFAFRLDPREVQEGTSETIKLDLADSGRIHWIDLPPTARRDDIGRLDLHLPAELLDEIEAGESIAKVIEKEDSLTLVLQAQEVRLIIHLTERFCLTHASRPLPALERLAATVRRESRFGQTPGFILFLTLDYLIDDSVLSLRSLERAAEGIDRQVEGDVSPTLHREILNLKREVVTLKHQVGSLRDALMKISGKKIPVVSESCRLSLADLYGHAQSLVSELDSLRELVHNSLEGYATALSLKMNSTMKVLTVFASIVLPMSLITGIYGMNFDWMPELQWKMGYPFALGLIFALGATLLILFKRKGWF